ncbi:MAG: glycosyl hydrolase [Lysobacterales bacterium]|nr:MAG: glycosyl hydrolase [Xanthomonadales bacterium]
MAARLRIDLVYCGLLCTLFCGFLIAAEKDSSWSYAEVTQEQHEVRLQWWNTARFGMFVHWGIYSVTGGEYGDKPITNSAEWMMNKGKIPIAEYEKFADQFNPTQFDAQAFVKLAKDAGMRYLVITAKHHDGFSMFGSKCSPYNVVEATPFKRDIMMELAHACRDQGLRFGFYYSQCQDWHHPGGMGNNWDKTIQRVSFDEYVRVKAAPEVKQLLTEYGPIGIFWWDTPRDMSEESFDSLHSLTALQPGIITNDRLGKDHEGDYKTFERRIPRNAPPNQDWEVCMPISGSWGYKRSDRSFKSIPTLIRNLVDIASKGGNYLLNVSPTGEGTLLPESVERLKAIGQWMKVNSESIYDTTASPFTRLSWGRCTKKAYAGGSTLYLHVFDWPENGELLVPGLKNKVQQTYLMADWKALETRREVSGIVVSLPTTAPDEIDSVVVMKICGTLDVEDVLPMPQKDGLLVLQADQADIHNNEGSQDARVQEHEGRPNIGYWTDAQAWVEWSFKIDKPGKYEVLAELAIEAEKTRFRLVLPGQQKTVELSSTGGYSNYVNKSLGKLDFDKAGEYTLQIRPENDHWQPINLRQLELNLQYTEKER